MRTTALARLFTLFASVAIGCSSTPTPTTLYLLPADVPRGSAAVTAPVRVGLGRVEVAPYLGEPGLVVETHDHQVRSARYHRWAEPLDAGLRHFLQIEISRALGYDVASDITQQKRWDYTVEIRVDRLHGTLGGEALLAARWRIVPKKLGGEVTEFRFAASEPLAREGYEGLVDAEIALTGQLAVAIAASLPQAPTR